MSAEAVAIAMSVEIEVQEADISPSPGPTEEQWSMVRNLLKTSVIAGDIPVDATKMRPKVAWQMLKDANKPAIEFVDYEIKTVRDKFSRMLRSLRKKHKDGDLEHEDKKIVKWGKSAAKYFLKKCFKEKIILPDSLDAKHIWENHCKGRPEFARMSYDGTFERRLAAIRDDYIRKVQRCKDDLMAFQIAKQNHPTPELNSRGEPQWNGSTAQKLLKELVARGGHQNVKPADLWQQEAEYQHYSLQTFRDHIYQEERLVKFNNYVRHLKKRKLDSLQY